MDPASSSDLNRIDPIPGTEGHDQNGVQNKSMYDKICAVDSEVKLSESFEPCLSYEIPADVMAYMEAGDTAMKVQNNLDAINDYSRALAAVKNTAVEAEVLTKRSAALASFATYLRNRPAHASENEALNGMDPHKLSKLALKDGERIVQLFPRHFQGYLRVAFANYLLENYKAAEESCFDGLSRDPEAQLLHDCLGLVTKQLNDDMHPTTSKQSRSVKGLREIDDFECVLCLKLLYDPVTTPCGHSFCRQCLVRSLDHNNKCPVCRTVLHVTQELPVSVTLKNIISSAFSVEYNDRRADMSGAGLLSSGGAILPLFVMSVMMPGEKMALNIFEPRYRLMIRRVMEGSRKLGMAVPSAGSVEPVAVECEIMECDPLPDGRFYVELVGRKRVKVAELWDQDGYRVAKVATFKDTVNEDEQSDISPLCGEVKAIVIRNMEILRAPCYLRIALTE